MFRYHGDAHLETSNIVPSLPAGSPITVPRNYADVIVTEYGAADLTDLDTLERARALVSIAHPAFLMDADGGNLRKVIESSLHDIYPSLFCW